MTDDIKDGGPAFPVPVAVGPDDSLYEGYAAMSQRTYIATAALQGLLASGPHDCGIAGVIADAVKCADDLLIALAAREQGK